MTMTCKDTAKSHYLSPCPYAVAITYRMHVQAQKMESRVRDSSTLESSHQD